MNKYYKMNYDYLNNLINLELDGAIGWDKWDSPNLSHKIVKKCRKIKTTKYDKKVETK